jgi:stage IV sporulation protein FB
MKNILKIDNTTYLLVLLSMFCGQFKDVIVIYVIIIFHELGHYLLIKKYHKKIINITIYPFGGITKYESLLNHNLKEEFLISLGGIFNQLLLFFMFMFLFKYHFINIYTYQLGMKYNTYLLIFNLLPIIPLDGSKALNIILENFFSYHLSNVLIIIISIINLSLFLIMTITFKVNNLIMISFLIYQLVYFIKNQKYLNDKFVLERYLYNIPYHKIKYLNNYNNKSFYQDTYHYFNYVSENTILNKYYNQSNRRK